MLNILLYLLILAIFYNVASPPRKITPFDTCWIYPHQPGVHLADVGKFDMLPGVHLAEMGKFDM